MRSIIPAFVVAAALLLVSCEKEEPHCDSVSVSSEEFLSYWYFPAGSWYAYELQGSPGTIDTVKVVKAEATYFKPDEYAPRLPCKMVYTQILSHTDSLRYPASKYNPNGWEKFEAQGPNLFMDLYVNAGRFATGGPIFNLPVESGKMLHQHIYMGDTSDVVTPAQVFEETVEIKNLATTTSTNQQPIAQSYYFSRNVGITKRVFSNGETWVLTDYFINK